MPLPVISFTDFGDSGPYVGQMRLAVFAAAPDVPFFDLMHDAPVFDPRASAYLLAALLPFVPDNAVILGVVDPGVGGPRQPLVLQADGRFLVGPDNGLFEIARRRARVSRAWAIEWRPETLSSSFHGRDLFAPVAARLAVGMSLEAAGCVPLDSAGALDWPDDLAEIIYMDHYGNAMTGLRADLVAPDAHVRVAGRVFASARTFSSVPVGAGLWYPNSCGLLELAVNQGRADALPGIARGAAVRVVI